MDQTLQYLVQPPCALKPDRKFVSELFFQSSIAGLALALAAVSAGCQTNRLAHRELPVPPKILDTSSLGNVRMQSPDFGADSRVKSLNRELSTNATAALNSSNQDSTAIEDKSNIVADVIIKGNQKVPTHHLTRNIRTRPGRYFDPDKLQQDVDQLWRMPEISRVNGPFLNQTAEGVIVTIEVVERNTIGKVEFIGNRGITDRTLR